ncbi:MAG TPA: molybdopterin converting factor subunit 1 [Gammaproteobacteria bacterium]|nr:molybdopterin converting factor subunit 1 [Gammaproteobacteria bacterium]
MKLDIHYFASIRERLGIQGQQLELSGNNNVADLIVSLTQVDAKFSVMIEATPSILVAVNQTVVNRSYTLSDGDEVAFFPPMTGG